MGQERADTYGSMITIRPLGTRTRRASSKKYRTFSRWCSTSNSTMFETLLLRNGRCWASTSDIKPRHFHDVCAQHVGRKLLQVPCASSNFDCQSGRKPPANLLIPRSIQSSQHRLLRPDDVMASQHVFRHQTAFRRKNPYTVILSSNQPCWNRLMFVVP